jgi:RNA polymerase sigma-70 factor, ECF subfamily
LSFLSPNVLRSKKKNRLEIQNCECFVTIENGKTQMQIDHIEIFWSDKSKSKGSPKKMLTPEELIQKIASDNSRDAFCELFKQFAPRIKSFMMGQGMGTNEAEDLAQDVLLLVWRKADSFDPQKAKASTWIFTIARNRRIDIARKANRAKDLPEDLWQDFDVISQEKQIINAQNRDRIINCFAMLNADQKKVLELAFYENLSHSQIAQTLSLPIGTVKSRIRLAISHMKTQLNQHKDAMI